MKMQNIVQIIFFSDAPLKKTNLLQFASYFSNMWQSVGLELQEK